MKYKFEQCLRKRKIVKISVKSELIEKERTEAEKDLETAISSLEKGDEKWSIIQGYYSQFHSFRALVFSRGYREKSHSCLLYAVEALFVDEGLIDYSVIENFSGAMTMREDADYGCIYSIESAEFVINAAKSALDVVNE